MTSTSPLDRISVLIPTLTNLPILAVSLPGHDEGKEEKDAPEDLDERRFAQRLDSLLDGCHRERVRGLHQLREASKRKARLEARIRVRQTEERELRHLLKLRRDENDLRKKELAIKNEQDGKSAGSLHFSF